MSKGRVSFALAAMLGAPLDSAPTLEPAGDGRWRAIWCGDSPAWRVSHGALAVEDHSGCSGAEWLLPSTARPMLSVIAVFAGEHLLAWRALARPSNTPIEVEAISGSRVVVDVAGRSFEGRSAENDLARVGVEVPPGVASARASVHEPSGRTVHVDIDLAPPPLDLDHRLIAPDDTVWLLRTDAQAHPVDGEVPEGAERVSVGVYRFTPPPVRAPALPAPLLARVEPSLEARGAWRVGLAAATGVRLEPALAFPIAWSRGTRPISIGAGGALIAGLQRHPIRGADAAGWRAILAAVAWPELGVPFRVGRLWVEPSVGAGGGGVWRRLGSGLIGAAGEWRGGAVGTIGIRMGTGRAYLDVRALLSTTPLGFDAGHGAAIVGGGWAVRP